MIKNQIPHLLHINATEVLSSFGLLKMVRIGASPVEGHQDVGARDIRGKAERLVCSVLRRKGESVDLTFEFNYPMGGCREVKAKLRCTQWYR